MLYLDLPRALAEVVTDLTHEFRDGGASMVACHIGMQILPYPFDLVGFGTVRRQEVELDTGAETSHGRVDDLAVVNPIVVENHMNHRRLGITAQQVVQQRDEQRTGFAFSLNPEQLPRPG